MKTMTMKFSVKVEDKGDRYMITVANEQHECMLMMSKHVVGCAVDQRYVVKSHIDMAMSSFIDEVTAKLVN